MTEQRLKANPFAPASYGPEHIAAIKALAHGNASPGQQQLALQWIIEGAAMTYQETMVPGQPDLSDYLAGRRNVGLQIVKLVNLKADQLKKDKQ